MTGRWRLIGPARVAAAVLALLVAGCGGSSSSSDSPSSPSYPAVKGTYGSYSGIPIGSSQLRWIAPDGTTAVDTCWAVTTIPTQNGAQFSGSVDRLAPCNSQGTLAGTIAADGTFTFTLTQARWGSCTMVGGGQYTGVVSLGSLAARGRVNVQCDDGRAMTIEEVLSGNLPVPPTTPG